MQIRYYLLLLLFILLLFLLLLLLCIFPILRQLHTCTSEYCPKSHFCTHRYTFGRRPLEDPFYFLYSVFTLGANSNFFFSTRSTAIMSLWKTKSDEFHSFLNERWKIEYYFQFLKNFLKFSSWKSIKHLSLKATLKKIVYLWETNNIKLSRLKRGPSWLTKFFNSEGWTFSVFTSIRGNGRLL